MCEVVIARPAEYERKVEAFRRGGAGKMCVVSDWDRTLTPSRTPDGRVLTT